MSRIRWTLKEAENYLIGILTTLSQTGYTAQIVGGVKTRGYSYHDLDILLTPKNDNTDYEALVFSFGGWDKVEEGGNPYDPGGSILEVRLPDGRIVDFIFSGD